MIPYDFYKDTYLGTKIEEPNFPKAVARAEAYVAWLERQYRVSCPGPDSRAMAICAATEVLAADDGRHNISASTVGDVSVHYFADGDVATRKKLRQAVSVYLQIRRGVA